MADEMIEYIYKEAYNFAKNKFRDNMDSKKSEFTKIITI